MKLPECPIGMEFHEAGWEVGDFVRCTYATPNYPEYLKYSFPVPLHESFFHKGQLRVDSMTGVSGHWILVSGQRPTEAEMLAELM